MDHLTTEARNPASQQLDRLEAIDIVRLMNAEDAKVLPAVAGQAEVIAKAIDIIADRLARGGRLIYTGAGTSGRLGVLDASECPPTFNSPPGQIVGVIAGGPTALTTAVEGAEDHPEYAEADLRKLQLSENDVVVGIASSGRTPYVIGSLRYARSVGAYTIGFACVADSELVPVADLTIATVVGPEVVTGSTRLKAGTATKMVLNMLTTGAMVRIGKTYGNLMVDLRATNVKLKARTNRIVRHFLGVDAAIADDLLRRADGELKTALAMGQLGLGPDDARRRLQQAHGRLANLVPPPAVVVHDGYRLGIDGGGTKTVAVLADRTGTILGRGVAGSSNIQTGGLAALQEIAIAIERAFAAANLPPGPVDSAIIGLAGAGRPDDREHILAVLNRQSFAKRITLTTDVELLFGALPEQAGIAVVCGTGSCVFGKTDDGRSVRTGGWGPLLGDEGSGYAIALAACRKVAEASEGRCEPTLLTQRMLSQMGLEQPTQLVAALSGPDWPRPRLAELSAVVFASAEEGDAVAMAILETAAMELGGCLRAILSHFAGSTPKIAIAGGILRHQAAYRARVLAVCGIDANRVVLVDDPAVAALNLTP
jgi:N-acetylmuramic acid 6-phosphate etherase